MNLSFTLIIASRSATHSLFGQDRDNKQTIFAAIQLDEVEVRSSNTIHAHNEYNVYVQSLTRAPTVTVPCARRCKSVRVRVRVTPG